MRVSVVTCIVLQPTGENGATRAPICIDLLRDTSLSSKSIILQIDNKSQQVSASQFLFSSSNCTQYTPKWLICAIRLFSLLMDMFTCFVSLLLPQVLWDVRCRIDWVRVPPARVGIKFIWSYARAQVCWCLMICFTYLTIFRLCNLIELYSFEKVNCLIS